MSTSLSIIWWLILCLNLCFGKKGSLFLICSTSQLASPIVLCMLVAWVVSWQIVKQSVRTSCLLLWMREGKHGCTEIHMGKTTLLAVIIWQKWTRFFIFISWDNWSRFRLTKWPRTIGIHFVIMLHYLPVIWLQGHSKARAHITIVSWLHVTMMRLCQEITIITLCYSITILL